MLQGLTFDFLKRLAKGISQQFGNNCEVVVHDLSNNFTESSIVIIENGHVTSRKAGDGPSLVVLEALHGDHSKLKDHLNYLTKTRDGKILKSSTIYIRDEKNDVVGIFSINYDITGLLMIENSLKPLIATEPDTKEPERIAQNVNDLLDELIEQSVQLVGKPVALMNKDDKIKAIQFLNNTGAFLITKSGDKVSKYFGISKYTLYSYIDAK
ncbi:putative transcriptional regulator YheO [Hydrogenoanaerobacterium saccharovorans]|uniref:Predicted transcriptional regulator YheO, contains PAS and DNA-binding HTH domains n=1 Tax=Hydrogenoanaerobacterium saccharovorans TaxID=474960 RepID=A0A1H7Z0W0_9FIRM|nr:helix-turn-helix transcriptional regulator [Hydrogenoanaerobacterium saccharovorans]RPF48906.1 putative transcriptional regulator YheO [Hydrogenoanaerobacterium saccharovorans]SEM51624.1 Predicted transcriptional regulator YheO, contains PAS and DNA-binding HTH domains [Hydrogenoanaerobacterium saccharovorans]